MIDHWFIRFALGVVATCVAVLVVLVGVAKRQQDGEPFDGPAVAVAMIDAQMEQTRRQVINLPVAEGREACAEAAWRPAMHEAVHILRADDAFAALVDEWAVAWGEGLVLCYSGDMANASVGIAEAYELKESMWEAATSGRNVRVVAR